jgi:hypothetical protein
MKRRNLFASLLALLMMVSLLTACSKSSAGSAHNAAAPQKPGIYDDYEAASSAVTDRKLIRRIEMFAETRDLDTLLSDINGKVTELGGYVENRQVYTGSSYYGDADSRSATLTIRIPAEKLDGFVAHVEGNSNVTSTSESTEDVTLNYIAIESRMKALQAEETRLLELIDEAANLSELLELEKRLTEVRTELEKVTSQLRVYDNLVDYGTVELSITEVKELTPTEKPGFWTRLGNGFVTAMQNMWVFCQEFVIFMISAIPYLLPFAIIAVVIVVIIRASIRRMRKKRQEKE